MKTYISLVIALVLVVPGYAYAGKGIPGNVPPIAKDVIDRLDSLETLIRRLHGNNAAVIPANVGEDSLGFFDGEIVGVKFSLAICPAGWRDNASPHAICNKDWTDLLLVSQEFGADDDDAVVTFTEETSSNFLPIIELLTNGEDDELGITYEYILSNGSSPGSGSHGYTERSAFFKLPQVSSGVGYVDLNGFDIGSISLSIDNLTFGYNNNTDRSAPRFDIRWFFELAH